jgi:hypothetical protein
MNFIVNNKMLAYKMGLNGRIAIKEEFNWQKHKIDYLSLFRK